MGRIIVYGDIHGCLTEFRKLREKLKIRPEDREVAIGDFLTKGPFSLRTLRYLRKNSISSILGNHEEKLLRYHRHELVREETGRKNPMELNANQAALYKELTAQDMAYLTALPHFLRFHRLLLVHGGLLPHIIPEQADRHHLDLLLRLRHLDGEGHFLHLEKETPSSLFWTEAYDGRQGFVVYGHSPFKKPRRDKYALGIDTGCVYGNRLTAAVFEESETHGSFRYGLEQVRARKAYAKSLKFYRT